MRLFWATENLRWIIGSRDLGVMGLWGYGVMGLWGKNKNSLSKNILIVIKKKPNFLP